MSEPTREIWSGQSTGHEQTEAAGQAIGARCRGGELVALFGELGAGKTQLVRGLARGLGIPADAVSSPTFVIAQEYEPAGGPNDGQPVLVHLDAYRLLGPGDLASAGWEAYLEPEQMSGEALVVAVEWPERLGEDLHVLPQRLEVHLSHQGPTTRWLSVRAPDAADWHRRGLADALNHALTR